MAGKLAVLSGFSGAGKGTVIGKLMESHDNYVLSVSMTTRKPRPGETDGREYHFVSNAQFEELIRKDGFLEHAGYTDNYYGTPRAFVEENIQAGRDVLLEIEVQGAMQIRSLFPDAVLIFITPPDAQELARRLTGRGTDDMPRIIKRLERAVDESALIPAYPYLIINDDIDACAASIHAVISQGSAAEDPAGKGGRILTDPVRKMETAEQFKRELPRVLQKLRTRHDQGPAAE